MGGWGWGWGGYGVGGVACMLNMINMDAPWGQPFAISIHVYMCMHAYTCMCTCVGTPPIPVDVPRHPPTHLSPPQSCREPKTPKFNKS